MAAGVQGLLTASATYQPIFSTDCSAAQRLGNNILSPGVVCLLQVSAAVDVACEGQGAAGARVRCSRAALGCSGPPTGCRRRAR